MLRTRDLESLFRMAAEGFSVSVVGLSNVGKSALLRAAAQPDIRRSFRLGELPEAAFIYVDCNLMLTLASQGFYEVTLRAVHDSLAALDAPEPVLAELHALHRKVVEPPSDFAVPLAFNDAVDLLSRELPSAIVLMFDEFDEPFAQLDSRVFLNLRALSDKHSKRLTYVSATAVPLSTLRSPDGAVDEFVELFVGRQLTLDMLRDAEARQLAEQWARDEGATLQPHELDFVVAQAGGHPGLIQAVVRTVLAVSGGAPAAARDEALQLARQRLEDDPATRAECSKLWSQLPEEERASLIDLTLDPNAEMEPGRAADLASKGILSGDPPRMFGAHFAGFVRRQRRARPSARSGVWVDVDAGDVTVDGDPVPTLTDLEYRLLLLLWGRLDKLCDKYQIVESVWGQNFIDEVDDARIEKLVSRLRAKLETDPANPRYLLTVRGRGYRLAGV